MRPERRAQRLIGLLEALADDFVFGDIVSAHAIASRELSEAIAEERNECAMTAEALATGATPLADRAFEIAAAIRARS